MSSRTAASSLPGTPGAVPSGGWGASSEDTKKDSTASGASSWTAAAHEAGIHRTHALGEHRLFLGGSRILTSQASLGSARVLEKLAHIHSVLQVRHIVQLPTPLVRPEKKVCGSLTACVNADLMLFHGIAAKTISSAKKG
jgi:hypothetical protein